MRNARNVLLAAGLLVVLSVFVAGCGRKSIATVNGDAISKEDFYNRLERLQIPTQTGGTQPAGILVLNQLINEKLIAQIAKDKNVTPTDAQINEKINLMKKEGALKNMEQAGVTMDDLRRQISIQQAYANVVSKGEKATEKEAKDFYDNVRDQIYKQPERVQVALIACREKKKIDEASKLLKSGQEFSTIAMRMSEDPITAKNGGVAGPVYKGMKDIPTKITDTAFSLKKAQISDPFQIPGDKNNMWYILKAMDKLPARTQEFKDVKASIMENIRVSKGQQKVDFGKLLQSYRKKAKINIEDKKYQNLAKVGASGTANTTSRMKTTTKADKAKAKSGK